MLTESHDAPDAPPVDGESLYALLAARARAASDGALVATCAIGLAGAVATLLLAPSWWRLAFPLVTLASFGAWGIADRSRGAPGPRTSILDMVRILATLVGTLAAIATALIVTAAMVGRLIS